MNQVLYALPVLVCPIGMALMMWFMMRSRHSADAQPPQTAPTAEQEKELARLRREVEALRGETVTKTDLTKDHTR